MRLRPLSKVLFFAVAIAVCVVGYLFLLSLLRNRLMGSATAAIFLAGTCFGTNAWFLRMEGRSMAAIGFDAPRLRIRQFGLGFLAGGVLVLAWALIVTVIASAHWQWHAGFSSSAVAGLLAFYFFNNAAEELAYRGYAFVRLEESYGRTVAIISTSMVFALMHMQGGMPLMNAVAGVLTNGLIFSILFSRWRSLPLALGFHLATNIIQDVSGLRQTPLSVATLEEVNTAGGRGVGILVIVACLNLTVFLLLVASPQTGDDLELWRSAQEKG